LEESCSDLSVDGSGLEGEERAVADLVLAKSEISGELSVHNLEIDSISNESWV
jgi:hypothetical protein